MPASVSAREAVRAIVPGSTIFVGESCGEPQTLLEVLAADRERLKGSRLIECRRFPGAVYAPMTDYFRIVSLHVTSDYREAVRAGLADFVPVRLSESHALFQKALPLDVALIQVSRPDPAGWCSLSVATGMTLDAARCAGIVIAEMNEQMPRAYGDNSITMDQISFVVETSRPLLEYSSRGVEDEDVAVGRNVAALIDNGSVLSIGIGGISDTVLGLLADRSDIGIHSGLITDNVVALMQKGVVTNRTKTINTGKTVGGVALGSHKLCSFMNENPEVEMYPFSYVHDVRTISRIDNYVAINSAVEVDLTGQVNAESLGAVQLSTIGGQADFIRGARLSKGGKNIIALSATTRGGKASKIVPVFKAGTVVSTPRYDVQYVVTEFGTADLWGKTLAERSEALIAIAHPKFRQELQHRAPEARGAA